MKSLLFHAQVPDFDEPQAGWLNFLQDASATRLPEATERLAQNVWLLPDDGEAWRLLSQIGHQHGIATRILPFCMRQIGNLFRPFSEQCAALRTMVIFGHG